MGRPIKRNTISKEKPAENQVEPDALLPKTEIVVCDISVSQRAVWFAIPYFVFLAGYLFVVFLSPETQQFVRHVNHVYVIIAKEILVNRLLGGNVTPSTKKVILDVISALIKLSYLGTLWLFGMSIVGAVWYPIPRTKFAWFSFGFITCSIIASLFTAQTFLETWRFNLFISV